MKTIANITTATHEVFAKLRNRVSTVVDIETRTITRTFPDGIKDWLVYDEFNRLVSAQSGPSTLNIRHEVRFVYRPNDTTLCTVISYGEDGSSYKKQFSFDNQNRVFETEDSDGVREWFDYNSDNRIERYVSDAFTEFYTYAGCMCYVERYVFGYDALTDAFDMRQYRHTMMDDAISVMEMKRDIEYSIINNVISSTVRNKTGDLSALR